MVSWLPVAGQHTEQNTGAEKLEEGILQTVEHIGGEHASEDSRAGLQHH